MNTASHSVIDAVVVHRRLRPRENAFRYRVAYLCLGLEALDRAAGRWLKVDRRGLISFRRADHGARDGGDLASWLKQLLAKHGLADACDGEPTLMTMPRMLGYVFNPVSFWFCRDRSGALRAVLCEVRNTFGERHCYLVHHADGRPLEPDEWLDGRKVFHVSPFLPVEGGYRFRFRLDEKTAHVDVNYHDAEGLMLATSVSGRREPLTDHAVLSRFLGNPTMTLGVIARIHWQALQLWRKRVRFLPQARTATGVRDPLTTLSAHFVFKALERLAIGRLTLRLPDGTTRTFGSADAERQTELHVRDWRFFRRILLDGDMGFAEAYMDGDCDSPDLPKLIALLAENQQALGGVARANPLHNLALKLLHRRRDNSREGSRRNIHAHYDLGNSFYRLWLDPTMSYSSALYEGQSGKSLEAAQTAKYDRILAQIGAKQGDSILEIGCGWGGFAETAARRGMRVTAVTISQEQLDYARERLERAGLADRVELQFRDYRDIEGRYDHIVSIEMIEAVGERYWPDYFAMLKRHVAPGGSALVQAIVIADEFFEGYRSRPDFIQTYIFPGGMLLSPQRLGDQCRRAGLKIAELYSFGLDYAHTLETWLGRFDDVTDQVARLGFDERFRRMWRYYLAYCAAGFSTRRTDVLQAHFKHL